MEQKKFFNAVFSLSSSNIFGAFSSFVSIALISKTLGIGDYGVFAFTLSVAMVLLTLSNTQSWQGILKQDEISKGIFKFCFLIDQMAAWAASLIFVIAIGACSEAVLNQDSRNWQYLFFITIAFQNNSTAIAIIRKKGLYREQAIIDLFSAFIKLVSVSITAFYDNKFMAVLCFVFSDVCKWSGYFYISKVYSYLSDNLPLFDNLKAIYRFSGWGMLTEVLHLPASQADRLMASYFIGIELLAIYDILKRVLTIPLNITNPILQICYPVYLQKLKTEGLKQSIGFMLKIVALLFISLSIGYVIVSTTSELWLKYLFNIEISPEIQSTFYYLLTYLTIALLFAFSLSPIHPLFLALGFSKKSFQISVIGGGAVLSSMYLILNSLPVYLLPISILVGDFSIVLIKVLIIYRFIRHKTHG